MSGLGLVDRLQTIAATATVTSAAWIVAGTIYLDRNEATAPHSRASPAAIEEPLEAGRQAPSAPTQMLLIPVPGVAAPDLTDTFGESRGERRHEAVDIMAPAGTPVVAAAQGTVEKLFRSADGGNTVYVRSGDRRTLYYYAHLQDYAPGLAEGTPVRRGQPLGTVGSTGNADPAAPHLHFAVMRIDPGARWYESATPINPYPLLVPR
jgi:murein DD-endopeptidase MepM/ murein hydrolase activator NlpD